MKSFGAALLLALLDGAAAAPQATDNLKKRDVDTRYPYTGPAIPVGDWVDPTVNGNGKGFPRLVEAPAVKPASGNPTNNINVISLSYLPGGVNIHFQTPFGLSGAPSVKWGTSPGNLGYTASGASTTYDRTPPCSLAPVTQCSQWFHDVSIQGLQADTTYFYVIQASNGTTASDVLSFKTAVAAGTKKEFTVAVLNDMGYTNAQGTFNQLSQAVDSGEIAFSWHGGDISYADDWYSGILPCASDWPVCYNGTSSSLPGGVVDNPDYLKPLPAGEVPNQGGPLGGDMSVLYESNWDLWQQWINDIATKAPYMVLPGNHEASCAEFDGPNNELTAYLVDDEANSTVKTSNLSYYSCPPTQRNFTAYQNRFHMAGEKNNGGVGNFWYSFDYGLAHFISIDGETDYPYSPEWPFVRDAASGEPTEAQTYITDSGPFGTIDGNNWKVLTAYQQYQWLLNDLKNVDRCKTPWVIAMSHRPMYSSEVSSYQANIREAFEALLLQYNVDVYLSGHIHWYERLWPLSPNQTIDTSSIVNNNTYITGNGKSLTHIINGMAGNIESHSILGTSPLLSITAVLNQKDYGFSKFTFHDEKTATWSFVKGDGSGIGDTLNLVKSPLSGCSVSSSSSSHAPTSTSFTRTATGTSTSATATTTGGSGGNGGNGGSGGSGGAGGAGGSGSSGSSGSKGGNYTSPSGGGTYTGPHSNSASTFGLEILAVVVPLMALML